MITYDGVRNFDLKTGTVVTIGTFDGVHVGHRKIIQRLRENAKVRGIESVVLTFFPHPRMVLQQDSDIKLINTIDERKTLLEQAGLDHLVVHPFTQEFSRLTAAAYVENILVKKLNAKKVIIGYDHRFGRNRNADINNLKGFGKEFGFDVEEISKQDIDDVAISSTKIRKALKVGDLRKANRYLGYPFMLNGTVSEGKKVGRTIGYPTANLSVPEDYKLIPAQGVYVARATINGRIVFGMTSIGTNPTVGGTAETIETFFFDFDGNLYGSKLQIELLTRIREERKFASVEDLKRAMHKDESFSRDFIDTHYA